MEGALAVAMPDQPPANEMSPDPLPADSSAAGDAVAEAPVTPVQIVEAVLFSADSPVPAAKIAQAVGTVTAREVRACIDELNQRFESTASAVRVQEIAGGFQLRTLPAFHTYVARLSKARQESKLSSAALETLSIVAYKQPVTRADVEAVRGVSAGDILNRLREMDLVKIVGRAEDLGRPMLYGTTKRFLEVFGLASLQDLPQIEGNVLSPPAEISVKGAGIARPDDMPTVPIPESTPDASAAQ